MLVYRLFDVADAVDLARAEAVLSAPAARLRLETLIQQLLIRLGMFLEIASAQHNRKR